MSGKYNRQIRKEFNNTYKSAYWQVVAMVEAKMMSANFFQRLKIATRYLLKKSFRDFL